MDYSKALLNLNPILRRRLHAIASVADMSEIEALELIVENSAILSETVSRTASNGDRGHN